MKKITTYFKPFKLEAILSRLPQEGVIDVLIAEVRGYGRQKGQLELYKGAEYGLMFLPVLDRRAPWVSNRNSFSLSLPPASECNDPDVLLSDHDFSFSSPAPLGCHTFRNMVWELSSNCQKGGVTWRQ